MAIKMGGPAAISRKSSKARAVRVTMLRHGTNFHARWLATSHFLMN